MKPTTLLIALVVTVGLSSCGRKESHSQTPESSETKHGAPSGSAHDHAPHDHVTHDHAHAAHDHAAHDHGHKGPLGHRFENAERWVPVFDDPQRDRWQKPEHVVGLLGLRTGQAVADIGAGTGYFVPHLARAVGSEGKVIAIDIEDDMVRYLKERAEREGLSNVAARKGTPADAKLETASVDRVLIVNTWHHIPDRASYARKLADSLRAQGGVFVIDYTMDSPHGPPKSHRMPPEQVVQELTAGGLDAKILEEELPYQYGVAGMKK